MTSEDKIMMIGTVIGLVIIFAVAGWFAWPGLTSKQVKMSPNPGSVQLACQQVGDNLTKQQIDAFFKRTLGVESLDSQHYKFRHILKGKPFESMTLTVVRRFETNRVSEAERCELVWVEGIVKRREFTP